MRLLKSISLAVLLTPFSLQAATVDAWLVLPDGGPFDVNDTFDVEIHASWDETIIGGGFDLSYDVNVVEAITSTINITPVSSADPGTIQPAGQVWHIGFQEFLNGYAPTADTKIATIEFGAVGEGAASNLILTASQGDNVFFWSTYNLEVLNPTFNSTVPVTVNPVPLPAAAWFMLSGLGFLAFRRKRAA